ncbi:MAG: 16S rRNA (guanine(966)-N(2))-methyltransferase RsmD [Deltaproteobacteria bacterium]|nr:16S rRNA (guanine(966)-N(2))-methyltransferase RsmD [Deltaproteobacteria bacterium]
MRITGGSLRGRRIAAPGGAVRPTAERVREALFGALAARGGIAGARALDLCAGSGALGIEALSRGAACALFVEKSARAAARLRANLAALDLTGAARVWQREALAALRQLAGQGARFELVLADPPYAKAQAAAGLAQRLLAAAAPLLAPGGKLVLEAPHRAPPGPAPGLAVVQERRYGDTLLLCYE